MTGSIIVQAVTTVESQILERDVPKNHNLKQNYRNPFNQGTIINYTIATVEPVPVSLTVYNIQGQEITELINDFQQAGHYEVKWKGIDAQGEAVVSGIYLYRLKAGDFEQVKTMLYLR